jgi:hypothetical protein
VRLTEAAQTKPSSQAWQVVYPRPCQDTEAGIDSSPGPGPKLPSHVGLGLLSSYHEQYETQTCHPPTLFEQATSIFKFGNSAADIGGYDWQENNGSDSSLSSESICVTGTMTAARARQSLPVSESDSADKIYLIMYQCQFHTNSQFPWGASLSGLPVACQPDSEPQSATECCRRPRVRGTVAVESQPGWQSSPSPTVLRKLGARTSDVSCSECQ